jgi:hypothetical protein
VLAPHRKQSGIHVRYHQLCEAVLLATIAVHLSRRDSHRVNRNGINQLGGGRAEPVFESQSWTSSDSMTGIWEVTNAQSATALATLSKLSMVQNVCLRDRQERGWRVIAAAQAGGGAGTLTRE